MKNNPILTIGIPSYKREDYLEKILKCISEEKHQERFVLLVCDDDDKTDTVKDLVKKYTPKIKTVTYIKNEKNLGFSRNVLKLYEKATTKYLWYICNDETFIPGAVGHVLEAIDTYEPTVAVFNCTWIDPYGVKQTAGVRKDRCYKSLSDITDFNVLLRPTFLSILLFERRIPPEKLHISEVDSHVFVQLSLSMLLLDEHFSFCEIAQKIIHRNVGFKYGEFYKFNLVDHIRAIKAVKHSLPTEKIIDITKRSYINLLLLYLSQKAGLIEYKIKKPTEETKKLVYEYYGNSFARLVFLFPLINAVLPDFVIKSLYWLKLISIHGFSKAQDVYKSNINRVHNDSRSTKFSNYK